MCNSKKEEHDGLSPFYLPLFEFQFCSLEKAQKLCRASAPSATAI